MPPLLAEFRPFENDDFLVGVALLVAALLVGGVVLLWLDRWRKRQAAADQTRSVDALSAYRDLYDRGELSRGEYEVIRGQLAHQMRDEIDAALEARKKAKAKPDVRRPDEG